MRAGWPNMGLLCINMVKGAFLMADFVVSCAAVLEILAGNLPPKISTMLLVDEY